MNFIEYRSNISMNAMQRFGLFWILLFGLMATQNTQADTLRAEWRTHGEAVNLEHSRRFEKVHRGGHHNGHRDKHWDKKHHRKHPGHGRDWRYKKYHWRKHRESHSIHNQRHYRKWRRHHDDRPVVWYRHNGVFLGWNPDYHR
ncbi:hypothetical protein [Oleiphilus messinensis]|uniref:hypothetical protein n=1 Tax=Oleiphilus messinensis TaxID=141451 RepID=UPI0018DF30D1|nr:hypothetical protein [Oleiphilus messinensis]